MTVLPEIIINKIIRYVSHPIANIIRHICSPTYLGNTIHVKDKVFWSRNTGNPTIKDYQEINVFEKVDIKTYSEIYLSDTI